MTLHELATRAEQAEGANYALDVEISDAIWRMKWGKRRPKDIKVQPYTASLDAAMMLVPEGWVIWQMGEYRDISPLIWHATLWQRDADNPGPCCYGTTPALALTAAALRAMAKEDV